LLFVQYLKLILYFLHFIRRLRLKCPIFCFSICFGLPKFCLEFMKKYKLSAEAKFYYSFDLHVCCLLLSQTKTFSKMLRKMSSYTQKKRINIKKFRIRSKSISESLDLSKVNVFNILLTWLFRYWTPSKLKDFKLPWINIF